MPTATRPKTKASDEQPEQVLQELEFTITAASFKEALGILNRFVPSKSTLPVLGSILICAEGGNLRLTANNLEHSATAFIGTGTIHANGAACVEARKLADWIRIQDDKSQIDFKLKKLTAAYKLVAKCGSQSYEFPTFAAEDFPPVPDFSGSPGIQFPSDELRSAVDQVAYAVVPDDTRPVLAGVLLKLSPQEVTAAAADGFRLAFRSWKSDADLDADHVFNVPGKFMEEVGRALSAVDSQTCTITWSSNMVDEWDDTHQKRTGRKGPEIDKLGVKFDRYTLATRLIHGQFPEYHRIVPNDASITADFQLERKRFLKAVRGAIVAARENSYIVRLSCENESLKVWAQGVEGDLGTDFVPVDWLRPSTGFVYNIAFNGKYLIDLLEHIPTDHVRARFVGEGSPGSFLPVGMAAQLQAVCMPMHVAR
jgi:DNA polymerase III subunit beta